MLGSISRCDCHSVQFIHRLSLVVGFGLALAFGLVVTPQAYAATTRTVCASGCDFTTIAAAIAAASAGDTISILDAVHTEAGIVVDRDLTIQGQGAALTIVQAATSAGTATDRVFTINGGVTATIKDMTIRQGHVTCSTVLCNARGGGIFNGGTLTLSNSTLSGNSASCAAR